jgi:hypothetical protein
VKKGNLNNVPAYFSLQQCSMDKVENYLAGMRVIIVSAFQFFRDMFLFNIDFEIFPSIFSLYK